MKWRSCTWIACLWLKQQHRTKPCGCSSKGYNLIKHFSGNCGNEPLWAGKTLNVSQQPNHSSSIDNVGTGEENCNFNSKSDVTLNLLKRHNTNLKNDIFKKDARIDYLTKQLFSSKSNCLNNKTSLEKDNTNEVNNNKATHD